MKWLTTEQAASILNKRLDCLRVTAHLANKRGDEHFKKEKNKMFIREDYINKVFKTWNVSDIYQKLIDKFGNDWKIAEALAVETKTSVQNCYAIVSTIFYQRRRVRYCNSILKLYEMVDDGTATD